MQPRAMLAFGYISRATATIFAMVSGFGVGAVSIDVPLVGLRPKITNRSGSRFLRRLSAFASPLMAPQSRAVQMWGTTLGTPASFSSRSDSR